MHPDEVQTDERLVARLIVDQFPDWASLPIRSLASSGTDNALYRLGTDLVVRLPKIAWAVPELDQRLRWLPQLAPQLSQPVAMPVAVGEPGYGYPWPWSIYVWLEGTNPVVGQVADPRSLAYDLAEFIRSLRSLDASEGPPVGFERGEHLSVRDEVTRAAIANLAGLIDTEAVTRAWDVSVELPASTAAAVWLHADLSPGNLLMQDGRLAAVLDFTPGVGLPDCELIVAWNLLPEAGREVLRNELGVEDDAWTRGRGWALSIALLQLDYYRTSNPPLADNARHVIAEVLDAT